MVGYFKSSRPVEAAKSINLICEESTFLKSDGYGGMLEYP